MMKEPVFFSLLHALFTLAACEMEVREGKGKEEGGGERERDIKEQRGESEREE